ncbi:hypothetical protein BDA96_09G037800 [Sorghum bicolor]|uniref:Replication factor A C-terminal domain-containing protein n=2 Tax=Sorghum bicolor TaxID=4558 RepID=A0A921U3P9_SORBI|nr:hypothetical protein BDA96_09G037800 [Sorghum bicolor]
MAFDLLPALRPRQWRSTICVRVCRKWEYHGGTDDGPIQHVDLVLLDEQGNSMYGEIPQQEVETKSPLLEEGGIYIISRFRVSNAKSGYRPVDSPYMVEFTLHTTISAAKTDLLAFPQYAYKITPIDALATHAGDTKNFLDTIGVLVEVSEAYRVRLPNKPIPILTRHIVLRDLSYSEIKITLWGERAAAFTTDGVYDASVAKPITVLFVGGLMKSYLGTLCLIFSLPISCIFRHRFTLDGSQLFVPNIFSYQGQKLEIRFPPAPCEDEGKDQAPDNGYRCTVTVARLLPNATWWFPSCTKCSKSCVPDGTGYKCNSCSNTSFKFKYKISFMALDGTDEAEMICFGDVARRIIGKPVQQILRSATCPNRYPPEITRIVSMTFTFAIALSQQSYYKQQKTYQIISVVTAFGSQPSPVGSIDNGGSRSLGSDVAAQGSSQNTSHDVHDPYNSTLSSPVSSATPSPAFQPSDPPSVKSYTR